MVLWHHFNGFHYTVSYQKMGRHVDEIVILLREI